MYMRYNVCETKWRTVRATELTLRKHVTKYKNMCNRMVEFLRKFENRVIKIARVNSIFITKSINLQLFTLILYSVMGPL